MQIGIRRARLLANIADVRKVRLYLAMWRQIGELIQDLVREAEDKGYHHSPYDSFERKYYSALLRAVRYHDWDLAFGTSGSNWLASYLPDEDLLPF